MTSGLIFHPGPQSPEFARTLEFIRKDAAPDDWAGSYLAWLLVCLRDAGLRADDPLVQRCAEVLAVQQRPNGSWEPKDDERYAVQATVEALRVLRAFGRT